jgi:hypothetical protein
MDCAPCPNKYTSRTKRTTPDFRHWDYFVYTRDHLDDRNHMGNGGIAMAAELFHGSALRWGECIKRWPIAYWAGVFTGIALMAVTFVVVIALAHHTPVFKLWYEWQIHSLENPDIQFTVASSSVKD